MRQLWTTENFEFVVELAPLSEDRYFVWGVEIAVSNFTWRIVYDGDIVENFTIGILRNDAADGDDDTTKQ